MAFAVQAQKQSTQGRFLSDVGGGGLLAKVPGFV